MTIKFDYNSFLIMDGEKLLSISHHFFLVFTCKNRIMLSVWAKDPDLGINGMESDNAEPTYELPVPVTLSAALPSP